MKHFYITLLFALVACNAYTQNSNLHIEAYTTFLQGEHPSAKDYILGLFARYDIVILCERDHREMTQYELILDILADKRFIKEVGVAYFEIGNTEYNDSINAFLHNATLTTDEVKQNVLHFHRNIYGAGLWEKSNYSYLLRGVHDINSRLAPKDMIEIYGLEKGVNWDKATEYDIIRRNICTDAIHRDAILAENFCNYHHYSTTGKALVILNYRHAFTRDIANRDNAGRHIKDRYGNRVANVFLNSFALSPRGEFTAIKNGMWDAAFAVTHNSDIGFDLTDTPFGEDNFDFIPIATALRYCDFFTGMVYYTPFAQLRITTGLPNFVDDNFAREVQRRYTLEGNIAPNIDILKEQYNTVIDRTYSEEFPQICDSINRWVNKQDYRCLK